MKAETAIFAGIGIGIGAWLILRRRVLWDLGPPLRGAVEVTSGWGDDRSYRDGWHEGLDFAAPIGTPVYTVAAGTVVIAHKLADNNAGKHVVVKHAGGLSSLYAHLDSLAVVPGLQVGRGDRLGTSGDTANPRLSGAAHLHFGAFLEKSYLALYARQFGKPATGWGRALSSGTAVPAEPLIRARYSPVVVARGKARGVLVA